MTGQTPETASPATAPGANTIPAAVRYLRRNGALIVGLVLLAALAAFVGVGHLVVDTAKARPLSVPTLRPPSAQYPLGTDRQGREVITTRLATIARTPSEANESRPDGRRPRVPT